MKVENTIRLVAILVALKFGASPWAQAQVCVELGTPVGQLAPVLKSSGGGFCPTPAQADAVCDCPAGAIAVGYEGQDGNLYGGSVLSQFSLRCRELNSDGTLGAAITVTCANGTAAGMNASGPVDAAAGQALVGAQLRIGCAIDQVAGESKLLTEVIAGQPNSASNGMTPIGGVGGALQPVMHAPDGSVFVGMQAYIDPGNTPPGATGISAGVAWRHAPIVPCAVVPASPGWWLAALALVLIASALLVLRIRPRDSSPHVRAS